MLLKEYLGEPSQRKGLEHWRPGPRPADLSLVTEAQPHDDLRILVHLYITEM
jgi:hypothetical protein